MNARRSVPRVLRAVIMSTVLIAFNLAMPTASQASAPQESFGKFCAGEAYASTSGLESEMAKLPARLECFSTAAQAYAKATDNPAIASLSDDQVAALDGSRGEMARQVTLSALPASICVGCYGYGIGTDYKNTMWDGSAGVIYWYNSDHTPCQYGVTYYSGAYSGGWNDVVSSAHILPASNCQIWMHWEHGSYSGKSINCGLTGQIPNQGCYTMYLPDGSSMSDKTSSSTWSG